MRMSQEDGLEGGVELRLILAREELRWCDMPLRWTASQVRGMCPSLMFKSPQQLRNGLLDPRVMYSSVSVACGR